MGEVGYKTLAIDIETFSDVDLIKCGVYAYADSPAFEILLFAYSFDDEETKIIDLAQGEQLTEEIKNALSDVGIIKTAFNANFERTCLSKYMGVRLSPESWVCTAVQSAMLALPLSLEGVGAVLGLSEQKLKEGEGYMDCCSFMGQIVPAGGQEDWCRYRIFLRIISVTWN